MLCLNFNESAETFILSWACIALLKKKEVIAFKKEYFKGRNKKMTFKKIT